VADEILDSDVNVKLKMGNYGGGEIPKSGGEKSPPQ
jgi:hypothetical protein